MGTPFRQPIVEVGPQPTIRSRKGLNEMSIATAWKLWQELRRARFAAIQTAALLKRRMAEKR